MAGVAADNGGPTETVAMLQDPANPAIGGADPATAPHTGQRGAPRDAAPDLGAFEVTKPVAVADSLGTGREMAIFFDPLGNDTETFGGIDVTTLRFLGADPGSDGRTLTGASVGLWANPTGGQDLLVLQGLGPAPVIAVEGGNTLSPSAPTASCWSASPASEPG